MDDEDDFNEFVKSEEDSLSEDEELEPALPASDAINVGKISNHSDAGDSVGDVGQSLDDLEKVGIPPESRAKTSIQPVPTSALPELAVTKNSSQIAPIVEIIASEGDPGVSP